MNLKNYFLLTTALIFTTVLLFAQEKEYKLNEIVVTAGRAPISFLNLSRTVSILNSLEIQCLPVNNIQDLLQHISAVDLRIRGAEGVQADVGIRGGTFEQTLILIDGVKISDPQTGHHNLNIPISLENVEQIEILKGQGSRIFGPNAFSGVINIITKKMKESSLSFSALGGEHGLFETNIFASLPFGVFGNNFSYSKKRADGYRYNTDFDITNFSIGENVALGKSVVNLFFGFVDKKFGANSFYSDRFPNQWEHTTTKFLNASAEFGSGNLTFSPKIYWRRNNDDYRLDNLRPDWYRNIHKTNSYGAELQSTFKTSLGISSVGGEISKEEIESTNLGSHNRLKGGLFAEQNFEPIENLSVSIGFFLYSYSKIGWKFWPGFDAGYQLNESVRIFAAYGSAFRIPTYTELYYKSPANMGNPNLQYEKTTNYEIGLRLAKNFLQADAALFFKYGDNLIDWVRSSKSEPWKVENVTKVKTYGTEFTITFFPQDLIRQIPITKFSIGYTFLTANRNAGVFESKYLLDHLRHQLIFALSYYLPLRIRQNWSFRYEDRQNFEPQFIIDTQLSAQYDKLNIFLRAANLFNKPYFDIAGVPLPGRWLSAGVKYSINNF